MAFKLKANTDGTASFLNGSDVEVVKFPATSSSADKTIVTAGELELKANITDLKEIGVGQTWQDVTGSRVQGTTYTNSTGKPIVVSVGTNSSSNSINYTYLYVDSKLVAADTNQGGNSWRTSVEAVVPNGSTYMASFSGNSYAAWHELR